MDTLLQWAQETGRIPASRLPAWECMMNRDPEGTRQTIYRMRPGVAAPGVWPCACVGYCREPGRCGGDPCERCGGNDWVDVRVLFTPWRGPVEYYPKTLAAVAYPSRAGDAVRADVAFITVHSGPPAPQPSEPTPEEILTACGIDPATVFLC